MGTGYNLTCRDCKVSYYLGYGSYTNAIWADTLAEYEADPRASECRLDHNLNRRAVLVAHEGHGLTAWADDSTDDPSGIVEAGFREVDLETDDEERLKLGIQPSPFNEA